eukprot:TRINITY_DN12914_c0_g1_i2.p1 TRINITY_DN12914_c0_g1~~TRINITY_DN12914_c0_g1_i2.p1  ORF type:complete len:173 (+),score=53.38 TRINITY_DN12914_c0_g1_i2:121-639(+)
MCIRDSHYTDTKQAHLDLLFSQIQGKSDSKISSSEREIKELQILIEEAKKNISRKKEQCERFKMQIRQTEEELERRYLKREEEYENVVIKGNRLLEVIEHLRRDLKALQCKKQQLEAEIEALKEELKNQSHHPLSYRFGAVSYTHLTLPTILLVQISVVAVSLKKKKNTNKH